MISYALLKKIHFPNDLIRALFLATTFSLMYIFFSNLIQSWFFQKFIFLLLLKLLLELIFHHG